MPSIEYLCIDDQQDNSVDILLDTVSRAGGPQFIRQTPVEVGKQIQAIADQAMKNEGQFGLLLDLRLDQEADASGEKVSYRGPTVAQELRTRMAEGLVPPFPIVLWSIANKLKSSYVREDTSHDLFDAVYDKDGAILTDPLRIAAEMNSLIQGYEALCKCKEGRLTEVLGLAEDDAGGVYTSFIDELGAALETRALHKAARLLNTQLIKPPGLLAEEKLVAARLGVDILASGSGWIALRDQLGSARYLGPFFEGWPRWWWFKVEDWWSSLSEKQPNLRRISAAERIQILNSKFNFGLIEIQPIAGCEGRKFFTLCVAKEQPLDPSDGLRVVQPNRKSWHDTVYVSTVAALAREKKDRWRIDPIDRDRLIAAQGSQSS